MLRRRRISPSSSQMPDNTNFLFKIIRSALYCQLCLFLPGNMCMTWFQLILKPCPMNECTLFASDKISFRQFSRFWGELCPGEVLVASPVVHFFILCFCQFGQFQFISGCKCELVHICGNFNSYLYLCLFVFVYSRICFHQFVQFWVELCPGVQFLRLLMFWRTWVQPGGSPCVKAPKVKKKSSFWQCNIKSHILKHQKWNWKNLCNTKCHVPKCATVMKTYW